MKKIIAIGLALALAGCNVTGVVQGVGVANNTLVRLAQNEIPAACNIVRVAQGYFEALQINISAKRKAQYTQASAVVKVICDNPPTDVVSAFGSLMSAWSAIQAATKTN